MANERLVRRIRVFAGKVKAASNIATLLFLAALGYTIYQWQRVGSFDNFINALTAFIVLAINVKFYRIHLNLSSILEDTEDTLLLSEYQVYKREYSELVFMALGMLAALGVFTLLT